MAIGMAIDVAIDVAIDIGIHMATDMAIGKSTEMTLGMAVDMQRECYRYAYTYGWLPRGNSDPTPCQHVHEHRKTEINTHSRSRYPDLHFSYRHRFPFREPHVIYMPKMIPTQPHGIWIGNSEPPPRLITSYLVVELPRGNQPYV